MCLPVANGMGKAPARTRSSALSSSLAGDLSGGEIGPTATNCCIRRPGRGCEFSARLRGSLAEELRNSRADAAPRDDQLESSPKAKTHVLHTTTTVTERARREERRGEEEEEEAGSTSERVSERARE